MMAARWNGVAGTFDDLPRNRQVDLIALYEIAWRIEAVNAYEAAKPRKRRRRGK